MASWTDNPQINFNPYVSQLPVEAMTAVGLEKQRRYDEGVQRIQASIDRIAGLDIARDVDKTYLRSKMNQLSDKLRVVAAGDFSNYQLVNSVSGMASKVYRDENILSAVASTAKMKEEDAAMKEAMKNGKSSANREYDYLRGRTEWLNDTTVGKPYDARYKQHVDVNKKVLDVIQKLNPNVNTYDIPYVIRPDGSIDYEKIHTVMVRRGEKGYTEGQIRTAITAMLDADDYDELASQGRFNYKDFSTDELQRQLTRNYLSSKERYKGVLENMQKQLLMTNDPADRRSLEESIEQYRSLLGSGNTKGVLDDEYATLSESLIENPDAVRARLYTKNWLDQMSNGFAYSEKTTAIMDNPYQNYMFKLQNLEIQRLKASKSADKKEKAEGPLYWKRTGDETFQKNEAYENWKKHTNALIADNVNILKDRADRYSSASTKLGPEDVLVNIEKYKNGNYTPNEDEQEQFDRYIRNENFIITQRALYAEYDMQARAELNKKYGLTEKLAVIPDLQLQTPEGTITFTSEEVLNYLMKEKMESTMMQSSTGAYAITKKSIDDEDLTKKEKLLRNIVGKRYQTNSFNSGVPAADKYFNEMGRIVDIGRGFEKDVEGVIAEKLSSITGDFATETASIDVSSPEKRRAFVSSLLVIPATDKYSKGWDEVGGMAKYKPKDALADIKDENSEFTLTRKGAQYFVDVIRSGDVVQSIPVSDDFIMKNPLLGEAYVNKEVDMANVMLRNNGTTNYFKDYDHAYYRKGSIGYVDKDGKNTVTIPIVVDLETETSGRFMPKLKLKLRNGTVAIPTVSALTTTRAEFETWLRTLTDDAIFELFEKNGYPNIRKEI